MADKKKKRISGTNEWSKTTHNIQMGCEHGCLYCYANARAARFKQVEPGKWTSPSPKKKAKTPGKRTGRIMFPSAHDITPSNIEESLKALEGMLQAGNEVLIVTKPHLDCVDRMTRYLDQYKDRITFRFTIGTLNAHTLAFWEPGAPGINERLDSLKLAKSRGFKTSVSCEPLLAMNVEEVFDMLAAFRPHVTDSIWIGRANKLRMRVRMNRPGDAKVMKEAETLEAVWCDENVKLLYSLLKDERLVKWKDSVKEVMGLPSQEFAGQDV